MLALKQRQSSSTVIVVTFLLLLLIGLSGVYVGYTAITLQHDAEAINELGIVRGSVQRLVHFEIMQFPQDSLIADIEQRLATFSSIEAVEDLKGELLTSWYRVRGDVHNFRNSPSRDEAIGLVESAEDFWEISNRAVLGAQQHAEEKLINFRIVMVAFAISWLLVAFILVWVKRNVQDSLEHLANYDSLTNVANRNLYNKILKAECKRAIRHGRSLSLMVLDIDHFKKVNDTHGHNLGDRVLKRLVRVIEENIRDSDTLARVGGEEFVVIAPETNLKQAVQLAEKLRDKVSHTRMPKAGFITVSIGVSQFQPGDNPTKLFKRADAALYRAKESGRNCTECQPDFV